MKELGVPVVLLAVRCRRFNGLATKPGRYNDGLGLYLVVNKGGSKQFILRTAVYGRRCDIGLGALVTPH